MGGQMYGRLAANIQGLMGRVLGMFRHTVNLHTDRDSLVYEPHR